MNVSGTDVDSGRGAPVACDGGPRPSRHRTGTVLLTMLLLVGLLGRALPAQALEVGPGPIKIPASFWEDLGYATKEVAKIGTRGSAWFWSGLNALTMGDLAWDAMEANDVVGGDLSVFCSMSPTGAHGECLQPDTGSDAALWEAIKDLVRWDEATTPEAEGDCIGTMVMCHVSGDNAGMTVIDLYADPANGNPRMRVRNDAATTNNIYWRWKTTTNTNWSNPVYQTGVAPGGYAEMTFNATVTEWEMWTYTHNDVSQFEHWQNGDDGFSDQTDTRWFERTTECEELGGGTVQTIVEVGATWVFGTDEVPTQMPVTVCPEGTYPKTDTITRKGLLVPDKILTTTDAPVELWDPLTTDIDKVQAGTDVEVVKIMPDGTRRNCFDSDVLCTGWATHPDAATQYECRWGLDILPLSDCYPYEDLETVEVIRVDPDTGEEGEVLVPLPTPSPTTPGKPTTDVDTLPEDPTGSQDPSDGCDWPAWYEILSPRAAYNVGVCILKWAFVPSAAALSATWAAHRLELMGNSDVESQTLADGVTTNPDYVAGQFPFSLVPLMQGAVAAITPPDSGSCVGYVWEFDPPEVIDAFGSDHGLGIPCTPPWDHTVPMVAMQTMVWSSLFWGLWRIGASVFGGPVGRDAAGMYADRDGDV